MVFFAVIKILRKKKIVVLINSFNYALKKTCSFLLRLLIRKRIANITKVEHVLNVNQ